MATQFEIFNSVFVFLLLKYFEIKINDAATIVDVIIKTKEQLTTLLTRFMIISWRHLFSQVHQIVIMIISINQTTAYLGDLIMIMIASMLH